MPVKNADIVVDHRRGLLMSRLEVRLGGSLFEDFTYLTPWWRRLLDDGMFPEDRYPLEVLTRICRDAPTYQMILDRLREPVAPAKRG
jgi:hypothetical protein